MKNYKYKLVSLILTLILCFSFNTTTYAMTNSSSITEDIQLINHNVVETVSFIDTDEIPVTIIKTTKPDNTFDLQTIKNGNTKTISGEADYNIALTFLPASDYPIKLRYIEKYLGSASDVTYIGPQWGSLSDLLDYLMLVPNIKVSVATLLAKQICNQFNNPVPLWIKKVTDSYEVHGDGNTGFLGYYHMYDWFYTYTHSNTSGSDYIASSKDNRYGTTPGI